MNIFDFRTGDKNSDAVRFMKKQMDEMNVNMQKHINELSKMGRFSADVMQQTIGNMACDTTRIQGGPGPVCFPIFHSVSAGPVQLPCLPPTPLLPSNDGMSSSIAKERNPEIIEASGSGNPHNKKNAIIDG